MTDKDQTYGEAVDETLEQIADAVQQLNEAASELREDSGVANVFFAKCLERKAEALAQAGLELDEKRRRLPFGVESAENWVPLGQRPDDDTDR